MTITQLSEEIGIDESIIDVNFGGKANLYIKCIGLFSKYDFIFEIENALNEDNYKIIEAKAHALKGVAANLGFKQLYDVSSKIVSDVRNNFYDEIPQLFKYLKLEYNRITNVINNSSFEL